MRSRLAPAVLAGALLAVAGSGAWAGAPSDQLHGRVDSVLKVLEDPEFKKDSKTSARRAALRAIADEIFDFREISQRSLGRHWQTRTPAEREEFVALFGDLLERTYVSRIEGYSGERLVYAGEKVDGDQVTVRTRIITKRSEEHTSELQSRLHLVCRLLLEKKKQKIAARTHTTTQAKA